RYFFSSRRRHTRFSRDWSSDVCSSDLMIVPSHLHSAMSIAVRGCCWMITPLMIELTCQWLQSGQADQMLLNQRKVLRQRGELLRSEERRVGKERSARWDGWGQGGRGRR